jgi:hypothetical protein
MTNPLNKIMESLLSEDAAAAESSINEWFGSVLSESMGPSYVLEDDGGGQAIWAFESYDDADRFITLAGERFEMLSPEEAGDYPLPDQAAPMGCLQNETMYSIEEWMQENGTDGSGYASIVENIAEDDSVNPSVRPSSDSSETWLNACGTFIQNQTSALAHADDQDQIDDANDAIETVKAAHIRFDRGFPDQGLAKLRELDTWYYEQVIDLLPPEYQAYAASMSHGGITTVRNESINTARRCGECGEIDAAMDESAEFCDQCIQEANERNPDLMGESVDPEFDALVEQFKGFTVADKLANVEGAQVGEADKVPVQTKSPVPNHKASDRVAGKGVEIKADQHKGYDKEKSPAVAVPTVKADNLKKDPKAAPKAGTGSALLNTPDKGNTTSPISGAKRK